MRTLLIALLVIGTVWIGMHVEHHHANDPFLALFLHLKPGRVLIGGEPLQFAVPAFLNFFTQDEAGHPTGMLSVTNFQVYQVAAVLLIFVCFSGCAAHIRNGGGDKVTRLFSGFALWIRDEMVYPVMGRDRGKRFLPFFLAIFFFILFQNLFGLLPGGGTATASIFVTGAMAAITLGAMLVCGMVAQGPLAFWINLVPHGLPLLLWPLMFVVELIGLMVKPFALMIRLFANMTGGHLIVLSCMGLIMFFGQGGEAATVGYSSAPLAVGFAVFIMIIETFVAMLQAFIFTQLSVIFVGTAVHPEH